MKPLFETFRKRFFPKGPFCLDRINFSQAKITIVHVEDEADRLYSTRLQFPIRQFLVENGVMEHAEDYYIINNWDGDNSLAHYVIETGKLDELKKGALFLTNIYKPSAHANNRYETTLQLADDIITQALAQQTNVFIFTVSPLESELDFYRRKYPIAAFREVSFDETMDYYDSSQLSY